MSLKRNILANYASQIYVMVIGIAVVPLYPRTRKRLADFWAMPDRVRVIEPGWLSGQGLKSFARFSDV